MPINLKAPQLKELKPRIVVCGVGAPAARVNDMIASGLTGSTSSSPTLTRRPWGDRAPNESSSGPSGDRGSRRRLQAGDRKAAAEERRRNSRLPHRINMVFLAVGMGGGTGTGAAPVIAAAAREWYPQFGVVTKPFHFECVAA